MAGFVSGTAYWDAIPQLLQRIVMSRASRFLMLLRPAATDNMRRCGSMLH